MAYQTEWHTFELNGSQMNGPPRMEFWTMLKEPGIDYGRLIQSSADETGSSSRTSCLYNSETHCSMCRGNFSPTCRMNCLNLLYSISAATNLLSLTCFCRNELEPERFDCEYQSRRGGTPIYRLYGYVPL